MRPLAALAPLLALGLSALTGPPGAAQGEAGEGLRTFRDWQAGCPQEAGCSASTHSLETGEAGYRLRVAPSAAGAGFEIDLLAPDGSPAAVTGLVVQVDDEAPLRLAPGRGAGPVIGHPETVRRLLRQMRAGGRLTIGFDDSAGQARKFAFSLWGVSAALDFIEGRSKRQHSAAALAAGDWSRDLADLLPAMRRCLVATPGGPALVGKAWPMNEGMAGVRTQGADGRRWDCVAARSGNDLALFDPVPDGDRLPGEGAPLFTPPGPAPPELSCHRHERARDASGSFAGWLSYPGC